MRTIGALDAILSIVGLYLLLDPISRGLFRLTAGSDAPYFKIALVTMAVTNGVLLLVFVLAAVQLLRLKKSGVAAHTIASALLIVYCILIAASWSVAGRFALSIAAAMGVGNLGIAPFQCFNLAPYVYPILSTLLLLVARRKMAAPQA